MTAVTAAPAPTNIKALALAKALMMLDASGAKYKVITPDGAEFGELEVKPVSTRKKTNNFAKDMGYIDSVRAMAVHDVLQWTFPSLPEANAFRAALASAISKAFGNGNSMTAVNKDTFVVEAMRLA